MSLQDPLSLCHAKLIVFNELASRCGFRFTAKMYRSFKAKAFRIMLSGFDISLSSSIRHCALKYEGKDSKFHFAEIEIPGITQFCLDTSSHYCSYNDSSKTWYQLAWLPPRWFSVVFDCLCELSDKGFKLVLVKNDAKHCGETVTFIDANEGTNLLVEADLKSPDYASLDEAEKPLPF